MDEEMSLFNKSLEVLSAKLGVNGVEKLQKLSVEHPEIVDKVIDIASFFYVCYNMSSKEDSEKDFPEGMMNGLLTMTKWLQFGDYDLDAVNATHRFLEENLGGVDMANIEENWILPQKSPFTDRFKKMFPLKENVADVMDEEGNNLSVGNFSDENNIDVVEEVVPTTVVKDVSEEQDVAGTNAVSENADEQAQGSSSEQMQTPQFSVENFDAGITEDVANNRYQHTISYVADALSVYSEVMNKDLDLEIISPAPDGEGDGITFKNGKYYLDDETVLKNESQDIISAKDGMLSIKHPKSKSATYSSIISSIYGMRDMMIDNGKIPFSFNFNVKTPEFAKCIGLSMLDYLERIADRTLDVEAVSINGTRVSMAELEAKVDSLFAQKTAGQNLDEAEKLNIRGNIFAQEFEDLFEQSKQREAEQKAQKLQDATQQLNAKMAEQNANNGAEINPFDLVMDKQNG